MKIRLRQLPVAIGVAMLPLIASSPLAAQASCQPVFDAMTKVVNTPSHIYNTSAKAGKSRTTETIYAGGAVYAKVQDKWTRGRITPQEILKQEQLNRQNSKYSCRYVKDEPVNGEAAALYSTHAENPDAKSDSQIWISKSRGLPLRQELDIDAGGAAGKTHYSVRYEFRSVKPPLP
jgi:hypothetical protein